MIRGEVWWATLGGEAGNRPVILVSRDEVYTVRTQITVAPVTTNVRNIRAEVPLSKADGLPRPCAANFDSMVTIPKSQLLERITALGPAKMEEVNGAIRYALGLGNS